MPTTLKAARIRQRSMSPDFKPTDIYLTTLPIGYLLERAKVDTWTPENPEGYQRPMLNSRLKDLGHYVKEEEGLLPTSVLICIREDEKVGLNFGENGDAPTTWGEIELPDDVTLWVIDGQHRLFGLKTLLDEGIVEIGDYPIPVSIFLGVQRFEEMRYFYLVNHRQKGVPTDVVDLQLQQMREKYGLQMLSMSGRLPSAQEREYRRARAVKAAMELNTLQNPWQGALRLPGEKQQPNHLLRLHSMVASLEPVMREQYTSSIPDADLAKLLVNYWCAISDLWPEASSSASDYQLMHTPGLYSLHMVFPDVIARCRDAKDFSVKKMKEAMAATSINTQFWHKSEGDRLVAGTNMASIRKLAQFIRESLPKLELPGINM